MVCRYDSIKYDNLELTAHTNTVVDLQAVLADDGYVVKYYRATIDTDIFINTQTVTIVDPVGGGIDLSMDTIRNTLLSHGKYFSFSYRGLGTNLEYDPSLATASMLRAPEPEILAWQPLAGNQAAVCKWRITLIFSRCPSGFGVQIDSLSKTNVIVSMTEEQEIRIDESGQTTISLEGTVEFSTLLTDESRENLRQCFKYLNTRALIGFNRTHQLRFNKDHRRLSYVIEDVEVPSDNPYFPFMIKCDVSHEIESSLLSDDVFSGTGFTSWGSTFEGSFLVRPDCWKGWAWVAFLVYLYNRRSRATFIGEGIEAFALDAKNRAENSDTEASNKLVSKQVPTFVRIREELTGRKVDISMKYTVVCSLNNLFEKTGMFYPVHITWQGRNIGEVPPNVTDAVNYPPDPVLNQWNYWGFYTQSFQNPAGYKDVYAPLQSLVFDPCDTPGKFNAIVARNNSEVPYMAPKQFPTHFQREPPYITIPGQSPSVPDEYPKYGSGQSRPRKQGSPANNSSSSLPSNRSEYYNNITPTLSWIKYENRFEIIEDTNNVFLPSIGAASITDFNSSNASVSSRTSQGFSINERTANLPLDRYANHKIQITGAPIYFVRMQGYAIRTAYQVPTPALRGIARYSMGDSPTIQGVIPVVRTGNNNRWTCQQLDASADVPTYLGMWDITYAVLGDPSAENIVFQSNSNAGFV